MLVSVVCPFYNEEAILENSVPLMLENLASLDAEWELILVNDGSTDSSPQLAESLCAQHPALRLVSYPHNRGRGHALRQGVYAAKGEFVVTTEIDSSWGDRVVHELYDAWRRDTRADIVIASPNLPGGGYKNVPRKRIWISRIGNKVLRFAQTDAITMYTGMTRGYVRDRFVALPLSEDGKEQHLEIVHKALAFGYRIREIPAILEWRSKLAKPGAPERKSSTKLWKTIQSHLRFSALARPVRYFGGLGLLFMLSSFAFLVWAVVRLIQGDVAIFAAIMSLLLLLIGAASLSFGVVTAQLKENQREVWRVQSELQRRRLERSSA